MVSPITSVAMLAAADKEVNSTGSYAGILGFQLRGKSLQQKPRNRVQTFSQNSEFFSSVRHFCCHGLRCLPAFIAAIKTGTLLQKTVNWMLYAIHPSMLAGAVTNRRITKKIQCQQGAAGCPAPRTAPCCVAFYLTAIFSFTISLGRFLPQL